MSLFGGGNNRVNTELFGYQVQSSLYGVPIPIVYGKRRISGNVIWTGDWQANQSGSGSKKSGTNGSSGKKGGQSYDYKTAIIIALCQGPINGIGYVWVDKVQYSISSATEPYVIPGPGGTYTVNNASAYIADAGASRADSYSHVANDYGSPGAVTLAGTQATPMTLVPSSPGAGQYSVNTSTGAYTFSAADAGKTVYITYAWTDPNSSYDGQPILNINLTLFEGYQAQAPWGYLTSNHPGQNIGYSELAYVCNSLMDLGSSGLVSNYNFEVKGLFPFGAGIDDANPAVFIPDFLSNPLHGVGFPAGAIGNLTQFSNYCVANGIFLSPSVDQQQDAATYLKDWCDICNTAPVWSEGVLKFIPYGDTTVIGNGATFTPNTTPVYDLDLDDFLANEGEEPLKITRASVRDAYNAVSVEWSNRGNAYKKEPLEEKDSWAVEKYGYRPASVSSYDCITSAAVAQQVANIAVKNYVYKRRKYEFTVSAIKYGLLEPMDLVTVSNQYQGLNKVPVRIISIEEDDNFRLKMTAEEFPWGTASPTEYPKQATGPFGPLYYIHPGPINAPLFFEATAEMTQDVLYTLLVGLCGGPNWGGCSVHVSTDGGNSYSKVGVQNGPTTMGVLSSGLPSAADPDITDILYVDLTNSFGALDSVTKAQADKFLSLSVIDQELISFESAVLLSGYHYYAGYLRRGVYGTAITQHPANAPFAVLDDAAFNWQYTQSMIGRTLYFKFTSFNQAGGQEENIANVTAFPYFVHGPVTPYPWAGTDTNTPFAPSAIEVFRTPSFGIDRQLVTDPSSGNTATFLVVTSTGIVNSFSNATLPPVISVATAPTGGSIPGNQVLTVGVYARDNSGFSTKMSLASIEVPAGTNTNTVTVTVAFANPATDVGYVAITPDWEQGWFGPGPTTIAIGIGGTSYTFTSMGTGFALNTPVPNPDLDHFVIQARTAYKFGVWGGHIVSIASIGGGQCRITFPTQPWTTNQFAGRTLSCYGRSNLTSPVPIVDTPIISNDTTSVVVADVSTILAAGDLVCCWMRASTFGPYTIGDVNILQTPLVVNAYAGKLVWIVRGTGAGNQPVLIASNTTSVLTTATPFEVTPDATSEFLVINSSVEWQIPTNALTCADWTSELSQSLPLPGDWRHYFIQVLAADANGDVADPIFSPWRIFFDPDAPASGNAPLTNNPTGFSVGGETYYTNAAGQKVMSLTALWTLPTDPAVLALYGGSVIVLYRPSFSANQIIVTLTPGTSAIMDFTDFPKTTESWQFWLISANSSGVLNTSVTTPAAGTPTTTISVSPPAIGSTGFEYTSNVSLGVVAVNATNTAEGMIQQYITAGFTPPSDPTWGGVEARVYDATSHLIARNNGSVSPIAVNIPNPVGNVTYTVKLVSYDVNNRSNTETGGTPQTTVPVGNVSGSFTTGVVNGAIGNFININASNIVTGHLYSVDVKVSNFAGSGVVTDITQGYDASAGINTGIVIKDNSSNSRIVIGPKGWYVFDSSNRNMGQFVTSSGGIFNAGDASGNTAVTLDGSNYQIYISKSGARALFSAVSGGSYYKGYLELRNAAATGVARVVAGTDGSDYGYVSMFWAGIQRYAIGADSNGKRMTGGTVSLSSGQVTVSTGLTTIDYANAIGVVAGENVYIVSNSGGSITFGSSNTSSSMYISWFAFGNS